MMHMWRLRGCFVTTDFSEHDNFTMRSKLGQHRNRVRSEPIMPYNVLVARSVFWNEFLHNEDAMKAYWKEWNNLENKQVWRWETLAEREEVVKQAKSRPPGEQEVHFGFLSGIMVEKGSEFPPGDERRYFKYRVVVFQGNAVKDQNWDVALLNEMSSQPATMDASRIADIYGCFDGNTVQGRDVEQAYLQADMEGPPVYITLPRELWADKMKSMRDPVVKLERHCMVTSTPVFIGSATVDSRLRKQVSLRCQKIGLVFSTTTRTTCYSLCTWMT